MEKAVVYNKKNGGEPIVIERCFRRNHGRPGWCDGVEVYYDFHSREFLDLEKFRLAKKRRLEEKKERRARWTSVVIARLFCTD